jgi:two-component system nitrogen regulation sensor histidine kinase NtrY
LAEPASPDRAPDAQPVSRLRIAPSERRRRRREWRLAALVALGLVALVGVEQQILALSRSTPIGGDAVFLALVHLNIIGIAVLIFLLGRNVVKLVVERRRGILGAKLNTKFVVAFVFVAAISTTALFAFSALLVNRAINAWLEPQVSNSLSGSLEIANLYYDAAEDTSLTFARRLARQIEDQKLLREDSLERLQSFIAEKQLEYDLGVVEVFSAQQEVLARATHPDEPLVSFQSPESSLIRAALSGVERTDLRDAGPGEVIRGAVPIRSTFQPSDVVGTVVVNTFISSDVGRRVGVIESALESYHQLQPSQGAFQTSMVLLLAMIALSIVLFASWIGFRLAKQVTVPIQELANATSQIAAGNLDVRIEHAARDEIGTLVSAFNRMATDLELSREDLEHRRAQMEIILRSVAAGVISVDREGMVMTINPSAVRLLGLRRDLYVGRKLGEVLPSEALETVEGVLGRLAAGPNPTLRRQATLTVGDQTLTLHWTISQLHDVEGELTGFVIVVDDVTQLTRAQRMSAWREIARRIAHEIKNPLTPIQLAAQRLRRKLGPKIEDPESQKLLAQYTDSITSQVEAMKLLLSEFSDYARLPATDPSPTDLNLLATEIVEMYRENRGIQFRTDLDDSLPKLDLDREQIKRVILNLIDNGIAAVEAAGQGPGEIEVSTRRDRALGTVRLEIADSGIGIRPEDRHRLFEPYFSTKRDGSGLGLAIVSRIVSDHSGYIRVRERKPRGTRFVIELPART